MIQFLQPDSKLWQVFEQRPTPGTKIEGLVNGSLRGFFVGIPDGCRTMKNTEPQNYGSKTATPGTIAYIEFIIRVHEMTSLPASGFMSA